MLHYGPVLTNMPIGQLYALVRRGACSVVKIVTGWGCTEGWQLSTRAHLCAMTPHTIVRTVAGDPSSPAGGTYPNTVRVLDEVASWLEIKPHCLIELGNEPNSHATDDDTIWYWRWHLEQTIAAMRRAYPHAQLIAPGLIMGGSQRAARWLEIAGDVMRQCDAIGIHVYEDHSFAPTSPRPKTHQVKEALALYGQHAGDRPWWLTEFGINDATLPTVRKGQEYGRLLRTFAPGRLAGGTFYHLQVADDIHPQYRLDLAGVLALRAALEQEQ